jgi:hypothetical protein
MTGDDLVFAPEGKFHFTAGEGGRSNAILPVRPGLPLNTDQLSDCPFTLPEMERRINILEIPFNSRDLKFMAIFSACKFINLPRCNKGSFFL